MLALLQHPNVVQLLAVVTGPLQTEENQLGMVTELLPRGSVYSLLHDNSVCFTWRMAVRMARDTARGMAFLHSADPPVLHRDLKSANLLAGEDYSVKICDFGISRLKADETMTSCGTAKWVSPEALREARYSEKSDVWYLTLL